MADLMAQIRTLRDSLMALRDAYAAGKGLYGGYGVAGEIDVILEANTPETAPMPRREMPPEFRADIAANVEQIRRMLQRYPVEIEGHGYRLVIDSEAELQAALPTPDPPAETPLITTKQRKVLNLWAAEYHKLGSDPNAAPNLSQESRRYKLLFADALTAALAQLDAQRHARAVAPTPLDDDYYQDFAESVFADLCEGDGKHTERLDIGIIADNAKAWFAAQREPVAAPKKLTVGELHALLNAQDDREIYILPDGTIAPGPSAEEVATLRLKLDAAVTAVQRLGEELEQERHARAAERREAIEECIAQVPTRAEGYEFRLVYAALVKRMEALRDQPRVSPKQPQKDVTT